MSYVKALSKQKGESPILRIRVSPEMLKKLQTLAELDRRQLSDYVRLALEDHLEMKKKKEKR